MLYTFFNYHNIMYVSFNMVNKKITIRLKTILKTLQISYTYTMDMKYAKLKLPIT